MGNLTDLIEQYLQQLLTQSGQVELQRRELAKMFRCVPSQINYVLETRFTTGRGYYIESRRGGGGFIRIYRVESAYPPTIEILIPEILSRDDGETLLEELVGRGDLSNDQALLIKYMLLKAMEDIPGELQGTIRARLIRTALVMVSSQRG